jgi:DNA-binding MarR family transcriptional regulator
MEGVTVDDIVRAAASQAKRRPGAALPAGGAGRTGGLAQRAGLAGSPLGPYYSVMNSTGEDTPGLAMGLIGAAHAVEARLEARLEPLGLSLAKLGVLTRLAEAGEPLPLGTLADRLACVRSNVTQLVDRLEAEKLVARVHDPRDRRCVRAQLTDEGRTRHSAGARALRAAEHEVFARVPARRRAQLAALARALQRA